VDLDVRTDVEVRVHRVLDVRTEYRDHLGSLLDVLETDEDLKDRLDLRRRSQDSGMESRKVVEHRDRTVR
jgi:hypothetical protein